MRPRLIMFSEVRQKEPELTVSHNGLLLNVKTQHRLTPKRSCVPKNMKVLLVSLKISENRYCPESENSAAFPSESLWTFPGSCGMPSVLSDSHVLWGHAPSVLSRMRAPAHRWICTCGCSKHEGPSAAFSENIFSFQPQEDKKSALKCTGETRGWSPTPVSMEQRHTKSAAAVHRQNMATGGRASTQHCRWWNSTLASLRYVWYQT